MLEQDTLAIIGANIVMILGLGYALMRQINRLDDHIQGLERSYSHMAGYLQGIGIMPRPEQRIEQ